MRALSGRRQSEEPPEPAGPWRPLHVETGGPMASRDSHDWMWDEALSMLARAERLHQQLFQPAGGGKSRRPVWSPPVDVLETAREVLIVAALPGVPETAVELSLDGANLVIAGERTL